VNYVPNGLNPLPPSHVTRVQAREELKLNQERVILLYTRFFEFEISRLADILSRVFMQFADAKLLLVGKGLFGEEQKFFEMAAARGWSDRVVDAGWVASEILTAYFSAADIAIFPFDDTLVNRCKCSVKLIDLLGNGLPVVAEGVGQVPEYIQHNETGMLVPPKDEATFANSVIELLDDSEKRARLGKCARIKMTQEFDWEKLAARVESVYRV
jgi:glycosyltransferase involved in cell wall biosynthesis